ncbi:MAG TPA: membrane dipeptidase, partial [Clostridia bacterium]|nr:membrane dipeptidase [Clostridia bacterium]
MFFADAHNDLAFKLLHREAPIGINSLIDSGVRFQIFSLFTYPRVCNPFIDALCQIKLIEKEAESCGHACSLHGGKLDDIIDEDIFVYVFSLEGAENLGGDINNIRLFRRLGTRIVGLTWNNDNEFCGNCVTSSDTGLLPKGKDLIRLANKYNIAVDMSHASLKAFHEVCELSTYPPMVSHSAVSNIWPHCRNIGHDELKVLIDIKGFFGIC